MSKSNSILQDMITVHSIKGEWADVSFGEANMHVKFSDDTYSEPQFGPTSSGSLDVYEGETYYSVVSVKDVLIVIDPDLHITFSGELKDDQKQAIEKALSAFIATLAALERAA